MSFVARPAQGRGTIVLPIGATPRYVVLVAAVWLPLAIVATLLCALVYGAVQQSYRQGANDPQIQMAEDAAAALATGQPPDSVLPAVTVDMTASLAPYLIVFDDVGRPIASSVRLAGEVPSPPVGVFDYTRAHGQDRITWQPRSGVRSAAIVARYGGARPGFVLAGRSLREVEAREDRLTLMVGIAWAATLGASLVSVGLVTFASARWLASAG